MWLSFAAFAKLICQIGLFVFFLYFFGIPNIKRYQQKEVMVVSSARKSGGILAPAIAVFPKNPVTRKGWRKEFTPSGVNIIKDLCGKAKDVQECIVRETYNFSEVVKYAQKGFDTGCPILTLNCGPSF